MKRNTLTQEGQERINKQLMPQSWKDDAMPMSDNAPMEENDHLIPEEQPLDANQIENYDNMAEVPVYDYLGREIGFKSVPRKKRRNNHGRKGKN